jgi:prephenate dehydratase
MRMPKRIAFLGPEGTYTEEAALQYDATADLQAFPSIAAVGTAVSSGMTDEGVVPIENSLEGAVTYTLDLLISQSGLSISREIVLPIEHYLMARPGTRAADIQVIFSHPQALAQCRAFLERCFPNAQQTASLSTVAAVIDMQGSQLIAAAIAPRRASELHDVDILGQNIQDNPNNVTRFVVLGEQDHSPTGRDKTSICFSYQQDAPGLLYRALGEFAQRGINLAKVESRPTKESLGRYIFLIDCEGHREDPAVRETLDMLRGQVGLLKVLGSYPRWDSDRQ